MRCVGREGDGLLRGASAPEDGLRLDTFKSPADAHAAVSRLQAKKTARLFYDPDRAFGEGTRKSLFRASEPTVTPSLVTTPPSLSPLIRKPQPSRLPRSKRPSKSFAVEAFD